MFAVIAIESHPVHSSELPRVKSERGNKRGRLPAFP